MNSTASLPQGVEILGKVTPQYAEILTPQALAFVATLARKFEGRRRELMAARAKRQTEFDAGKLPDSLPQTRNFAPTGRSALLTAPR